ncbi:MAG TPA: hypothetical protein DCR35_02460 [Runella sp.]|nr:hypothetical protein [Runella sp.]HAO48256.1 hypothetical protein [Runella sp.]
MKATLNFSANIQLTLSQLVELARQLPPKDRAKLASMLIEADADGAIMSKKELKAKIKEGLQDAKLHREGKIKLRTLTEFLENV